MSRKNIVLVDPSPFQNPPAGVAGFQNLEQALPRSSLTQLSAPLKQDGHRVNLLDLSRLSGWEDYGRTLKILDPDWVCITAHTLERNTALQCARLAKQKIPNCRTALGGIHFSLFPEEALKVEEIDYVIRGEGDISLPALVRSPSSFSRVSWGTPPNLDQLPFADRELYPDYEKRTRFPAWDLPIPIVDVITARGCPWKCRFCCGPGEQTLFTRPSRTRATRRTPYVRRRSPGHVLEELRQLEQRYGFRGIIFHDDQFLMSSRWNEAFCKGMVRAGYPQKGVAWWAACRADMICSRPESLDLMRQAGLSIVSIGFESFNDRLLTWMNKGTSAAINYRAARIAHDLGLKIFANVMFGLPGPDGKWRMEDDLTTYQALLNIRPHWVSPSYFTPVPGSDLHSWAYDHGLPNPVAQDVLGTRTPNSRPIKGVDYTRLDTLVCELRRRFSHPWQERLRRIRYRLYIAFSKARQRSAGTPGRRAIP